MRIALVDDNPVELGLFGELLDQVGETLRFVWSRDAIGQVCEAAPDVVVLDDNVGALTANDTLAPLKRALPRNVAIIMISGNLTPQRRKRLLELGADDAFSKDDIDRLINALRAMG